MHQVDFQDIIDAQAGASAAAPYNARYGSAAYPGEECFEIPEPGVEHAEKILGILYRVFLDGWDSATHLLAVLPR